MNKSVKLVLLGLMIWLIKFIVGGLIFVISGEEASLNGILWTNSVQAFFIAMGLALALFLVYRDKEQDYKSTAWKAGITWYVVLLLMDLIVLVGILGLKLGLWFPLIFSDFEVLIIPIIVGYLLARHKTKAFSD